MEKRTYDQKLANIQQWVKIVNHHWNRLNGNLHADETFWDETLHSMTDRDWWDWVEIAPALKIQYEDDWRRWSRSLEYDGDEINKKLMLGKPVVRKNQRTANTTAFRLLMNIKDFINDINGTPTPKPQPVVKVESDKNTTRVEIFWNHFEEIE